MTYTALLMLAILRDNFERLDLDGVARLLAMCQQADGRCVVCALFVSTDSSRIVPRSFIGGPDQIENDIRFSYCAFAIAAMTGKWDAFDVTAALRFVQSCQNYDGGFGQGPNQESQGGSTYCSVACFSLAHRDEELRRRSKLSSWLLHRQQPLSGFNGRAEKPVDTCYSFWCGAALTLLGSDQLVDPISDLQFLMTTQSRIGGFAKTPGEMPDAMHSYMGLAAIALHAERDGHLVTPAIGEAHGLQSLHPGINLGKRSASWLCEQIQGKVKSHICYIAT